MNYMCLFVIISLNIVYHEFSCEMCGHKGTLLYFSSKKMKILKILITLLILDI